VFFKFQDICEFYFLDVIWHWFHFQIISDLQRRNLANGC